MKNQSIPWNEISSYLKREADMNQKEVIDDWLKRSDENQKIFNEIVNSWQLTKKEIRFYQPQKELLWKRLLLRINYRNQKLPIIQNRKWWPAVAAVLVVVFITGMWFGKSVMSERFSTEAFSSVIAPSGSKSQIVLPDDTKVWLNSGAEIRYPQSFTSENREVFVSGECYFDVTKNQNYPFIVHTSGIDIKVLGTKFNVKENRQGNTSEVILVSGKVQVLNKKNSTTTNLDPGQQLVFKNNLCVVEDIDNVSALTAWINNMLVFDDLPFEEVTRYLESWYGVKINLDSSIYSNHRYTFKVKTESLREVLELISVITPIEYNIKGEQVSIRYEDK